MAEGFSLRANLLNADGLHEELQCRRIAQPSRNELRDHPVMKRSGEVDHTFVLPIGVGARPGLRVRAARFREPSRIKPLTEPSCHNRAAFGVIVAHPARGLCDSKLHRSDSAHRFDQWARSRVRSNVGSVDWVDGFFFECCRSLASQVYSPTFPRSSSGPRCSREPLQRVEEVSGKERQSVCCTAS
jgi:hypothetical protein